MPHWGSEPKKTLWDNEVRGCYRRCGGRNNRGGAVDGSGPGLLSAIFDPRCGAQVMTPLSSVKAAGILDDDACVFESFEYLYPYPKLTRSTDELTVTTVQRTVVIGVRDLGAETHIFPVQMCSWVVDSHAGCDGDHEEVAVGAGLTGVKPLLRYPTIRHSALTFRQFPLRA